MNNQREIYEALLDGEKIHSIHKGKGYLHLIGGVLFNDLGNVREESFTYPSHWQVYEEPAKWCVNIPEGGVLCWVKNRTDRSFNAIPHVIYSISATCYIGYELWNFATPLTKQEIQTFIENAPED